MSESVSQSLTCLLNQVVGRLIICESVGLFVRFFFGGMVGWLAGVLVGWLVGTNLYG